MYFKNLVVALKLVWQERRAALCWGTGFKPAAAEMLSYSSTKIEEIKWDIGRGTERQVHHRPMQGFCCFWDNQENERLSLTNKQIHLFYSHPTIPSSTPSHSLNMCSNRLKTVRFPDEASKDLKHSPALQITILLLPNAGKRTQGQPQLLLTREQLFEGTMNSGQSTAGFRLSRNNWGGVNISAAENIGWHGSHGTLWM